MRYILLHADRLAYWTVKPALRRPPDPPGEYSGGPLVAVFVTVEEGDDESVVERAARDIAGYASDTVGENRIVIYPYAHLSNRLEKPHRAHRVLGRLEARLRELLPEAEVHRAPFGWYKGFEIRVKGHPLSELSRSLEPAPPLGECQGGAVWSLSEAADKGCLPSRPLLEPRPEGLYGEKRELLGIDDCSRGEALHYQQRLLSAAQSLVGGHASAVIVASGRPLRGADDAARLLARAASLGGLGLLQAPCPLESIIALPSGGAKLVLEALGLSRAVEEVPLGGTTLLLYRAGDHAVLVGAKLPGGEALGPVGSLVSSKVHLEAKRAGEGETPMLPLWLHPWTAAVIPHREAHIEYARSAALELSRAGANVLLLPPSMGSLGRRIRWAGKRWIPVVAVAGEREAATGTLSVRKRWRPGEQETLTPGELASQISGALARYGALGRLSLPS